MGAFLVTPDHVRKPKDEQNTCRAAVELKGAKFNIIDIVDSMHSKMRSGLRTRGIRG